jgi:hypothetical protein
MHYHVPVVEKNPVAVIKPFNAQEFYPLFRKLVLDEFGDGLYLRCAFPGTDDKIIGYDGETGEIKDNRINGLLLEGRLCRLNS